MDKSVPVNTPLWKFIRKVAGISFFEQENRCIGVLDKVQGLPAISSVGLAKAAEAFRGELNRLNWGDVARWIEAEVPSYQKGIEQLADAAAQAHELAGSHAGMVTQWNDALRQQLILQQWAQTTAGRKILCAFSSAVDATYDLKNQPALDLLLNHAARFTGQSRDQLLSDAYRNYRSNPVDRNEVATVEDVMAELMFSCEHPTASLKPVLKKNSQAEEWMRKFYIDHPSRLRPGGGGGSFNIADALAGLGFTAHVFWPYHSQQLAEVPLSCLGSHQVNDLQRCWFDPRMNWKGSPFQEAGNIKDSTGCPHPVRLSIPVSFSPQSPSVKVPGVTQPIRPAGTGRVIFQFAGYRSADFFTSIKASPGSWQAPTLFCRWRWHSKTQSEKVTHAEAVAMKGVKDVNYHRLILSGCQRLEGDRLKELSRQCGGLRVHHEISATFDQREAVTKYCEFLRAVFSKAKARTAGINAEELQSFTSWHGTEVFAAVPPQWGESLLQRFLRAAWTREVFDLDWIYVHGNELDLAVVKPGAKKETYLGLRRAMLLAKVAVFAALNVRSDLSKVTSGFEPCCSPKGFLALYRFAHDLARQFAASEAEQRRLHRQILVEGYVDDLSGVPGLVVVPVYWPEPKQGFSATGAGDITSGVVAALAP